MSFTISNSTVLKTTDEAFKWDRDHAVGKDEDREINVFPSKLSDAALVDLEKAAKEDGDTRVSRAAGAILRTRKGDVDIAVPNFKAFHSILTAFLRKSAANGWIFVEGKDGNSYPELVTDVRYERARQPGGEDLVVISTAYYGIGDNADKIARAKTSHSFTAASLRGRRVNDILLDKGIQVATEEMIAAHEASLARYHESVATKFSEQFRFTGRVLSRAGQDRYANKPAELRNRRVIHDLASTDHGPYARIEDSTILVDDEGVVPEHPVVRVFDLSTHDFFWCHADQLRPYVYDRTIKDKLILPESHHDLLDILTTDIDAFVEDFVEGKSTGNVILCKGPPGVGKTTTAEAYAEIMGKPLYRVHAGSLGTTAEQIAKNLRVITERATRWDCVLLLDEADVFVKRRGDDLEQNAVVAEFLRILEYIEASRLTFLTTNRPDDIDDAIISRCAAIISYHPPVKEDMRAIWSVYNKHFDAGMSEKLMDDLIPMFPGIVARDAQRLLRLVLRTARKKGIAVDKDLFRRCAIFRAIEIASEETA